MELDNITYLGQPIDNDTLLEELPSSLAGLLRQINGFILHHGALHVRGVCEAPDWHSLEYVWRGQKSLSSLYDDVASADIPFAQDCFGDQYLLRDGFIMKLDAETGQVEEKAESFKSFLESATGETAEYLNVDLGMRLEPGRLWHVYPPFCTACDGRRRFQDIPAMELISAHAESYNQIKGLQDGASIRMYVEP